MKRINNLSWTPAWTSVIGCIHGCLRYLDIAPDLNWVFGGTGHAFLINMSQDGSCPSGPTAWITDGFFELGKNLGYSIESVIGNKREPGWKEIQKKAWQFTKNALDEGIPVFGWELAIPEFYVIEGYDDVGYYYNGPGAESGKQPKPWRKLGQSGIGMMEIISVSPSQPSNTEKIIRDGLSFAIEFNHGSSKWVLPEYQSGSDAYQVWIDSVESGRAMLLGHAYNSAVWEECRRNGLEFLKEAKRKLDGKLDNLFDDAIRSYDEVAQQLRDVTELYPFFENDREEEMGQNSKSERTVEHLKAAQTAEAQGSDYLEEIVQGLS